MTWEAFYLLCFVVGFVFSVLAALGGGAHARLHVPHLHLHGHAHVGHAGGHGSAGGRGGMSPLNASTISAFLAWFGGAGYLLTRYSSIWALLALGLACVFGLVGAACVFWFLVKVMLKYDRTLDPADYEMVGVLGKVSAPVREGGTGEMIFVRDGARSSAAVRSDGGAPIARDAEVVVTRYEGGIAYVRRWEEMAGMEGPGGKDAL
jgi:membrane protein implicated in regulation of membrane protease activity